MRAAFLTDVHANLPALQAVLAHARDQHVDAIWNGGDMVGYGPDPDACVRLLRAVETAAVVGNYDRKVLQVPDRREKWSRSKHPLKLQAFTWTFDQLSEASRAYLGGLPEVWSAVVDGVRVRINHASPVSLQEHLGPHTSPARWRELAALADADLVLSGHTHVACQHREGAVFFVNPGAVGRPEGGDPRAGYAIVDIAGGAVAVTLHRVAYDTEATAAACRAGGLPEAFAQMFLQGRPLGEVLTRRGR